MSFAALIEWSLKRRILVIVAAALLVALGLWQSLVLRVDVLPELTRPSVTIHLEAPSLSAADASAQLALPVEGALLGLPDLVRLRSSSVAGLTLIQAEFAWGTDAFRNRQLVTERLDATRALLPPGIEPRLGPMTSLMGEVMLVALRDSSDAQLRALRTHADWTLRPALLAVPGVSQVTVIGGEVAQWEVRPDPMRMKLFDIGFAQIVEALRGQGENRGGGIETVNGREHSLRGVAMPLDPTALKDVAIAHREAGPVWLGQVASIAEGARTRRGAGGAAAEPAVILAIQKQPQAETLALTAALEERLAELDSQLAKTAARSTLFRQADYIRASVSQVRDALWHGALIVALVLAAFLSGGRANLISLIAIPVSVAGAILVLSLFGLTLNTLTLGGLAIAVGELVDDAVVGVENVARRLRESATPDLATVAHATLEVRSGILQATWVIVAGFLPLFALGGVEGRLFAALGLAYVAAILVSLVVAATLTPVLCALGFLGGPARTPSERTWLLRLRAAYQRRLDRVLDHGRGLFALCVVLLLLAAAALLSLPRAFLPTLNESTLTVNLVLTPGIALAESGRVGQAAERLVLDVPEVLGVGRRTGRAELDEHAEGVHYSEIDVQLGPSGRSRTEIVQDMQRRLSVLSGAVSISQPISHRIDHLLSGVRAPVAIKILGEDAMQLDALAAKVRVVLQDLPGLREARLDEEGRTQETRIKVDAARAALYGLAPARVLDTVSGLSAGLMLSQIVEPPRRAELVLRLDEAQRDPRRLADLLLDAPAGPVPLGWIADIDTVSVPDRIVRENGRRRVLLSAFGERELDAAVQELQLRLDAIAVPPGHEIRLEGQQAQASAASRKLALLSLLAVIAMAAILYLRFRALAPVLIVLGSIPLAWVGGAFALRLTGTPLSLASLIGFVTLAGIASRNSILKIGRYLDLEAQQGTLDLRARVLLGAGERLAPVLMTSAVAALSLLPLLIGAEAPGKEILHPVALVVFGGLIGSTLLDSVVTPVLYLRVSKAAVAVT